MISFERKTFVIILLAASVGAALSGPPEYAVDRSTIDGGGVMRSTGYMPHGHNILLLGPSDGNARAMSIL